MSVPVDRWGSQMAPHDIWRSLHGKVQGKCYDCERISWNFSQPFKMFLTITSSLCLCYREASQISRVSTQSACYPAASTTGPTRGRWPHPLYTRVSSGLSWKSQLWCRKNRCVHVFCKHFHCDHKTCYVFHHIPHCTGHREIVVVKCSRLFESDGFCLCVYVKGLFG